LNPRVDLDGEVRRVDPDRWLTSRFISDPQRRAAVVALYAFDHELARAEAATSNQMAAEIRLTWWGETISEAIAGRPVRRHPTAEALADVVRTHSLPEAPFMSMIEARGAILGRHNLAVEEAVAWSKASQGGLAQLAAEMLGAGETASQAEAAGTVWGLALLRRARRAANLDEALRDALPDARERARALPAAAFPAALMAALARADLRSQTPSEVEKRLRLAWASLTGRL
jgi:phytoene synthase